MLLELVRREQPRFADGAVLVRLEHLTDPALVAAEIATALARRDGTDGPSADGLPSYLRERELLMAVDNFEHLLAAAALIAELLALAPRIRVLVSSRTALRIRGEQAFEVEPLALPEGDSAEELARSPAMELFLQAGTAVNRKLALDDATTPTVAAICRALDGLPLAIELAASRSHLLSPAQIADQLARPLLIGEHALRDLPDRQQTLHATIRWSYDLLTAGAREVLSAAAVFLGGFTPSALEAVTGGPARAQAEELSEASLVRRQTEGDRFELLELVRAFALEELQDSTPASEARARHRRYFAAQVTAASAAFDAGGAPGEIAAPLLADHANLRAAVENAIETGDQDAAVALGLGLRPLWLAGSLRQEGQSLVDRLLDRFSLPGETEIALLRAVASLEYGPSVASRHRQIMRRATEIGDHEALAMATGNLFGQALNTRNVDEMRRLRPQLLALITPEASAKALGWIQYFLALDAYVDGVLQPASEHASACVAAAEAIGHEYMLGCGVGARLLVQSARDGVLRHDAVSEAVRLMRRPGVEPLAAVALWFAARYAAGVAPRTAGRWLADAERIVATLDSQIWPESVLRDESLEVLGISDPITLLDATVPRDHAAALAEAAAWLAGRDPAETTPRHATDRGVKRL